MGHDYVFSMVVGTIGKWLKLVPFLLGDEQLILSGGGQFVVCLCLHIKKGKDHFDTFNAQFIFAQSLIILHLSKGSRCRLIYQTDALTMYNVFYLRLGRTSIGHARTR